MLRDLLGPAGGAEEIVEEANVRGRSFKPLNGAWTLPFAWRLNASEGKIAFDTLRALGDEVIQRARIYVWPLDQRPQSLTGRRGSLHAKSPLRMEKPFEVYMRQE